MLNASPQNYRNPFMMQLMRKMWMVLLNSGLRNSSEFLFTITDKLQTRPLSRGTAHRGQVCFHEQRVFPKAVRQQACALQTRKIWQAYCRIQEILIAQHGVRRQRAIANLDQVHQWLPALQVAPFRKAVELQNFTDALQMVNKALEEAQRRDRSQRISCWKCDMRSEQKKLFIFMLKSCQ